APGKGGCGRAAGRPRAHAGDEAVTAIRPHFYSQVDFDGRDELGGPTPPWQLPGPAGLRTWYPAFGPGFGNASAAERTRHAQLFDPFNPARRSPQDADRPFAVSNLD